MGFRQDRDELYKFSADRHVALISSSTSGVITFNWASDSDLAGADELYIWEIGARGDQVGLNSGLTYDVKIEQPSGTRVRGGFGQVPGSSIAASDGGRFGRRYRRPLRFLKTAGNVIVTMSMSTTFNSATGEFWITANTWAEQAKVVSN